jgi:hypothetical protein
MIIDGNERLLRYSADFRMLKTNHATRSCGKNILPNILHAFPLLMPVEWWLKTVIKTNE